MKIGRAKPQDMADMLSHMSTATSHDIFADCDVVVEAITENEELKTKLYRLAAEQGDSDAQSNLGSMYLTGQGVSQNDEEAFRLFRLAAEQGNAVGQNNVGRMYELGRGVPQNYDQAVKWYRLSAEQGYDLATQKLKNLNLKMQPRAFGRP